MNDQVFRKGLEAMRDSSRDPSSRALAESMLAALDVKKPNESFTEITTQTINQSSRGLIEVVAEEMHKKISMLGDKLPRSYGMIETTSEAIAAAVPREKEITLRIHIVWDNDVSNLDVERVLDHMRETGAAMIVKVEQVS